MVFVSESCFWATHFKLLGLQAAKSPACPGATPGSRKVCGWHWLFRRCPRRGTTSRAPQAARAPAAWQQKRGLRTAWNSRNMTHIIQFLKTTTINTTTILQYGIDVAVRPSCHTQSFSTWPSITRTPGESGLPAPGRGDVAKQAWGGAHHSEGSTKHGQIHGCQEYG